ncbi:MAG: hypothetical protein V3S64_13890 [bacterium]
MTELYNGVIAGTPFGIGIASKAKGLLGASLKLQLNQRFPARAVTKFVKGNFKLKILERLFESDAGLAKDERENLFKVTSNELGLPRNSIVFRIENPSDANLRAVIFFGGERLAMQLENRLNITTEILEGRTAAGRVDQSLVGPEELKAELEKLNIRRLFDYDMNKLSTIVNGLEDSKNELPKALKPAFKSVSDYIIKKRMRR